MPSRTGAGAAAAAACRGRGGELAGLPGVARAGAAHAQRGVVGAQVVRRGAGDAGGDDVAGAGAGAVRGEVDQAVVAGAAGHAVRGGVLAALALGDEDLDDGAVLPRVLLGRDLLDERDEPVVALLDDRPGHLVRHGRGRGARADRVLEGERGGEPGLADEVEGGREVLLGLAGEADDDVRGDRRVRDVRADVVQDREVAVAAVGAAHRLQDRVGAGLQRHVQRRHDVRRVAHRLDHVVGEVPRVRRGEPDPLQARRSRRRPAAACRTRACRRTRRRRSSRSGRAG